MKNLILPKHLLGHTTPPSHEVAWKENEVIPLINEMLKQDFAPTAWQAQYRFPDGVCDLYWVGFQNDSKHEKQEWKEYVNECYNNFLTSFKNWTENKDIKKEVMNFKNVREFNSEQIKNIDDYKYFLIYSSSAETPEYPV